MASVAKDHSTHPITQAFDFVRIGGAPEAFGDVEELLLFALLRLFGYRGILPSLHNRWYMYYRRCKAGAQVPEGVDAMSKKHMGSSIDDFLKEEGVFEEAQAQAVKEVVAWQLAQAMKEKKISKNRMATLLKTSRTQVDRLLDARNDITLSSLERAAAMVGRRVTIRLV